MVYKTDCRHDFLRKNDVQIPLVFVGGKPIDLRFPTKRHEIHILYLAPPLTSYPVNLLTPVCGILPKC